MEYSSDNLKIAKSILSLYLNNDRIYYTIIRNENSEWYLDKIDSTNYPLKFDNDSKLISNSFQELNAICEKYKYDEIKVVFPNNLSLISKIPFSQEIIDAEDLAKMLELETSRTFANSQPDDFLYDFYLIDAKEIMTVISPKILQEQMKGLLSLYKTPIEYYFSEHFSAANLFSNNYSNLINENVLLISLESNEIFLNIMFRNQIVHSAVLHYESNYGIPAIVTRYLNEIIPENNFQINKSFVYGSSLTKVVMEEINNNLKDLQIHCERLNPFSELYPNLSDENLEYCSRAMQFFPACIGASLPQILKRK
ncbi:MAG: hypothetical protein A2X64_10400 [Ignavibacteria bacterium GWF2_33_9]|nr:MAG: hypothetical protein A2X64_10400 [Ignavibacteria bacterium GWF2_33_9]